MLAVFTLLVAGLVYAAHDDAETALNRSRAR